jgi:Phasin protein
VAEKSGKDTRDSVTLPSFGFEGMMDMQRPAFTAMAKINSRVYESIAAVNKEWASFVNRRLKVDLAMPQQLAECKTAHDLYRVYGEFFQNAYADYQSELEQMTRLSQLIAENAMQGLQSRVDDNR